MRVFVCFVASLLLFTFCASAATDAGGTYKGTWSGGNGGGEFTLVLDTNGSDKPSGNVSFTLDGQPVLCKITSLKLDGLKVTVAYTFDFDGMNLESVMSGVITGSKLEGTYKTKSVSDGSPVDEGTCKATKTQAAR